MKMKTRYIVIFSVLFVLIVLIGSIAMAQEPVKENWTIVQGNIIGGGNGIEIAFAQNADNQEIRAFVTTMDKGIKRGATIIPGNLIFCVGRNGEITENCKDSLEDAIEIIDVINEFQNPKVLMEYAGYHNVEIFDTKASWLIVKSKIYPDLGLQAVFIVNIVTGEPAYAMTSSNNKVDSLHKYNVLNVTCADTGNSKFMILGDDSVGISQEEWTGNDVLKKLKHYVSQ